MREIQPGKISSPSLSLRGRASGTDADKLKLVHITTVGAVRGILSARQIDARPCKVFRRNLAYFFVLRPGYRLRGNDEKRSLLDFFPCALIFGTGELGSPFHVYPFDTGGARDGAFDDGKSPWVGLGDYELDPTFQAAADQIEWAFGSREAYFNGDLKPGIEQTFPDWEACAASFVKIARLAQEGSNKLDKRASAIEVAFDTNVPLSLGLEMVILPRQFLEDPRGDNRHVSETLDELRVTRSTYDWMPNKRPQDFELEIRDILREHLVATGSV